MARGPETRRRFHGVETVKESPGRSGLAEKASAWALTICRVSATILTLAVSPLDGRSEGELRDRGRELLARTCRWYFFLVNCGACACRWVRAHFGRDEEEAGCEDLEEYLEME